MVDVTRKIKKNGQVYTPTFIVNNILDTVGYEKKIS